MEPVVYAPQPLAPTHLQTAPAVLPGQQMTVAYVPAGDGRMVAAYVPVQTLATAPYAAHPAAAEHAQAPTVVRAGVDPVAQRLAGFGVAAAGVGFGTSEVIGALAGAGTGLLAFAVAAAVWKAMPSGSRTVVNNRVEHHHHTTARGLLARANSRVDHNRFGGVR